jgi:hypothetical protein
MREDRRKTATEGKPKEERHDRENEGGDMRGGAGMGWDLGAQGTVDDNRRGNILSL